MSLSQVIDQPEHSEEETLKHRLKFIPRIRSPAYPPVQRDYKSISIYHECEGRIEKSVPRITVWHHEACQWMANGDPERLIFLSYCHTNNGFFFLLTTVFLFLNKLSKVPEYAKMQFYTMTSL